MKVYRDKDIDGLRLRDTAMAIGEFDALHIGHMRIINTAIENAKALGLKSLVLLFENNPLNVILNTDVKPVNELDKRIEILDNLGVDIAVIMKFDNKIKQISRDEFFNIFLVDRFGAKSVTVGFNFKFGKNGEGNAEYLKTKCAENNIKTDIIPEVSVLGNAVSSTAIRGLIANGNVFDAAKLLGRFFSVKGSVVKGNQIGGKILGFPTANIEIPGDCIIPGFGVYISRAVVDGRCYPSITNVGDKPSVAKNHTGIETHIIGAKFGKLYDKIIEVEFCKYLRKINTFANTDALINQLEDDKNKAIIFFKEYMKK